jgi:hypothetical protein
VTALARRAAATIAVLAAHPTTLIAAQAMFSIAGCPPLLAVPPSSGEAGAARDPADASVAPVASRFRAAAPTSAS